jgi:nickel/cobalt transporter (NicO) family protein
MFFSPCLELEAFFFNAGAHGLSAIAVVSIIYLVITILTMLILVSLAGRGMEKVRLSFLSRHDKAVTGSILVLLGIFAFVAENAGHVH